MKNKSIWIFVAGILLIGVGAGGILFTKAETGSNVWNQVSGYYNDSTASKSDAYSTDELNEEVKLYIADFDNNLEIGETFAFDNGTYYYSILESDTGKGAMELLVNSYTKTITLEYGPAMMWNVKYGMHQYSDSSYYGRGRMGSGRMGYCYDNDDETYYNSDYSGENDLTKDEAYDIAAEYLSDKEAGASVDQDGLAYYGYYNFHVTKNGEIIGILSVNGFTGAVWYNQF